jgi:hypothetical protein
MLVWAKSNIQQVVMVSAHKKTAAQQFRKATVFDL